MQCNVRPVLGMLWYVQVDCKWIPWGKKYTDFRSFFLVWSSRENGRMFLASCKLKVGNWWMSK